MHTSLVTCLHANVPILRVYGQYLRREHTPGTQHEIQHWLSDRSKDDCREQDNREGHGNEGGALAIASLAIWVIVVINERN